MTKKSILKACRAIALTEWVVISSQISLAETLGIDWVQVTKWLSGKAEPTEEQQVVIIEFASIWDEHCKLMQHVRDLIGEKQ